MRPPPKTLQQELKNESQDALSDSAIEWASHGKVTVTEYITLGQYNRIEDIPSIMTEGVILFYPVQSRFSGHYVCMWINEGNLFYFDPYGFNITKNIYLSNYLTHHTGERTQNLLPALIRDFQARGGHIYLNDYAYQDINKPSVSTCGKHCLFRLHHKNLSHNQYKNYIKYKALSPDEIVTMLYFLT